MPTFPLKPSAVTVKGPSRGHQAVSNARQGTALPMSPTRSQQVTSPYFSPKKEPISPKKEKVEPKRPREIENDPITDPDADFEDSSRIKKVPTPARTYVTNSEELKNSRWHPTSVVRVRCPLRGVDARPPT